MSGYDLVNSKVSINGFVYMYSVELYAFRSNQCSLWEAFILKVLCFLPTISIVDWELWATVLSVQDSVGTNSNFE